MERRRSIREGVILLALLVATACTPPLKCNVDVNYYKGVPVLTLPPVGADTSAHLISWSDDKGSYTISDSSATDFVKLLREEKSKLKWIAYKGKHDQHQQLVLTLSQSYQVPGVQIYLTRFFTKHDSSSFLILSTFLEEEHQLVQLKWVAPKALAEEQLERAIAYKSCVLEKGIAEEVGEQGPKER